MLFYFTLISILLIFSLLITIINFNIQILKSRKKRFFSSTENFRRSEYRINLLHFGRHNISVRNIP